MNKSLLNRSPKLPYDAIDLQMFLVPFCWGIGYRQPMRFARCVLNQTESKILEDGAIFCEPHGDVHIFWGSPKPSAAPTSTPAVYFNDFYLNNQSPFLIFPHHKVFKRKDFEFEFEKLAGLSWRSPDREKFKVVFDELKMEFESELQKAVPVVFEKADLTNADLSESNLDSSDFSVASVDAAGGLQVELQNDFQTKSQVPLLQLIENALFNQGERWIYGIWNSASGFVGATPELLYSRQGKHIKTMALAGTSLAEEALNDSKNKQEQKIVSDEIMRRLSKFGEVKESQSRELVIGTLKHIRTEIECAISDKKVDFVDEINPLIEDLHPTPALGHHPKPLDRNIQKRFDSEDRRSFGAPFGVVFSADQETLVVSIRNVDWKNNVIRIGSGCGVIKESVFELEWKELAQKRQSVKEILGL